jgi:virginiamycin B lyase
VLLVGLLIAATAGTAGAATDHVTEFPLEARWISSLSQGPEGDLWYAGTVGTKEHPQGHVGRVGPNGPLGEVGIPMPFPTNIAVGSEGVAWLTGTTGGITRLSSSGSFSETATRVADSEKSVASAGGGGIWFLQREDGGYDSVGRISSSGQVSEFPIPDHESGPKSIVEGHEGDAWFTEYFADKIGRVTPTGQITGYQLPEGSRPTGITVDGEGNIWVAESGADAIGRITPEGVMSNISLPSLVSPGAIAAGPDGRIWFTQSGPTGSAPPRPKIEGTLGRITPTGRYSEVELPDQDSGPVDLVAGAEGDVWFAAMGEHPCFGGGGTCMLWEPENPAIVGRVAPAPLTTAVAAARAPVWRNRIDAPISCGNGDASETCQGTIEAKIRGKRLARSRYSVPIDSSRQVMVRRIGRVRSLLEAMTMTQRALIIVRPDSGKSTRRAVTLVPHK